MIEPPKETQSFIVATLKNCYGEPKVYSIPSEQGAVKTYLPVGLQVYAVTQFQTHLSEGYNRQWIQIVWADSSGTTSFGWVKSDCIDHIKLVEQPIEIALLPISHLELNSRKDFDTFIKEAKKGLMDEKGPLGMAILIGAIGGLNETMKNTEAKGLVMLVVVLVIIVAFQYFTRTARRTNKLLKKHIHELKTDRRGSKTDFGSLSVTEQNESAIWLADRTAKQLLQIKTT